MKQNKESRNKLTRIWSVSRTTSNEKASAQQNENYQQKDNLLKGWKYLQIIYTVGFTSKIYEELIHSIA